MLAQLYTHGGVPKARDPALRYMPTAVRTELVEVGTAVGMTGHNQLEGNRKPDRA